MKLARILLSQAVRLAKVAGAGGGAVYGLNLAKACEDRYGFLQAPRILADYDLSKGVTLLHGYFQQRFVIDRFQVFENGILAEARVDTDECDEFLDDVLKLVVERAGITIEPSTTPQQKLYLSQIEVQSDISLNKSFAKVAPLGRQISDLQRGYGQIIPDLEVSGLSLGTTGDAPSFKFERREGPSVPPDLYFASCRLRTKDHIKMLEALEKLL
jgi:hypothetical protein